MVGQIIKKLRKEKGISQYTLADALLVDRSTVAKYEAGYRTPDIYMLCRIADYFGVSTDYLLERTDVKK